MLASLIAALITPAPSTPIMRAFTSLVFFLTLASAALASNLTLVADYAGNGFFDQWQFYGNYDNLTNGVFSSFATLVSAERIF